MEEQGGEPENLKPVFQPPSLLQCAIRSLGKRPEVMASRESRNAAIPVPLFLSVIKNSSSYALTGFTADRMRRIQANMPCLVHESVDMTYWKHHVASSVQGPITMPYPVMVEKAVAHKKVLEEWVMILSANPKQLVPDNVMSILQELSRFPASPRFLKDTMIATAVSAVAKLPQEKAACLAKDIKTSWKQLVTAANGAAPPPANDPSESPKPKHDPLSPLAIGERATTIKTWKEVYEYSLEHDALKRAAFSKRARAMREEEQARKEQKRTKDVTDEEVVAGNKDKRPPAGNTERIKKLVGMKPPIGHLKPKGAGGIKFTSSKQEEQKRMR